MLVFKELNFCRVLKTVLHPNPPELITEFCNTQKKFSELISKNQLVREILDDTATIKDYYQTENAEESERSNKKLHIAS